MRVSVEFGIETSKTAKRIAELPARLRDMRPLMEQGIAPATEKMLRRHWESQGAAFGHKWAPLEQETIRKRIRRGTLSKGILRDTDHLFRSLFRAASAGRISSNRGHVKLSVSTKEKKAVFHQVGTQFMPERLVIPDPLPTSFRQLVTKMVRTYLRTGNVSG